METALSAGNNTTGDFTYKDTCPHTNCIDGKY